MTCDKVLLFIFIFIHIVICGHNTTRHVGKSNSTNLHVEKLITTTEIPENVTQTKDKVEIKVFYETLCPFSASFFVSQLKPAVERLGPHLDIHLIPYGHAMTRRVSGDSYAFYCHHGVPECFGNRLHACGIDVLNNITQAVYFSTCLMKHTTRLTYEHQMSVFHWCGYIQDANVRRIWECMDSRRGSELLKLHGDETHALRPSYVPYLIIDGSIEYQNQASNNLIAIICRLLQPAPSACLDYFS